MEDFIDSDLEIEQCLICCEDIVLFAIGECGHNQCCWNCILRQRLKMQNEACPYCKESNSTVLISANRYDTIKSNKEAVCDTTYDIHF